MCRFPARLTFACVLGRVFGLPQATEPPSRRSAFAYCSSDQDAIANPGCAAACVLYSCLFRLLLLPPLCGCAAGFSTICGWASTPGALSVIGRSKAACLSEDFFAASVHDHFLRAFRCVFEACALRNLKICARTPQVFNQGVVVRYLDMSPMTLGTILVYRMWLL